MEPAVLKHVEQQRVPTGGASDRDASIGLGLGEVQALRAVREHRRKGLAGIEPSLVDFADVGDQIAFDASGATDEVGEPAQQLVVRHVSQ